MASRTRATRKPVASASNPNSRKPNSKKLSPETLADDIQSRLKISNGKDQGRTTESQPTKRDLMTTLNTASAQLTSMVQQSKTPSMSHKAVKDLAEICIESLKQLRIIDKSSWDIERAAGGIVARLIALGDVSTIITTR
jgi:hypothetical protein